jgi:peptidoglycan/xylan/chitin deacetylase (PgdA/CDA1 family)
MIDEPVLAKLIKLRLAPPKYLLAQGVTSVPAKPRRVALTFDNGPTDSEQAILPILTRFRAHATFFCIGSRSVGQAQALRAILAQGSEIGNHTYWHLSLIFHPLAWDEAQITRAETVFASEVGVRPIWVRPRGGWVDQTGIDAIKALHMRFAYWDDAGQDTVKTFSANSIARSVLRYAHPGAVILLHEKNPRTIAALPLILRTLERRGYWVTSLGGAFAK